MGLMRKHWRTAAILCAAVIALSGCEGDDGNDGAPGPQGPPGPLAPVDIADATEINATIQSVEIASPPVMRFTLLDKAGRPIVGVPPSRIRFVIAKLTPGTNGNASAWQSYINEVEEAGVGDWPGTEDTVQATRESGADGELIDNGDGTYQYTYEVDVENVPGVPYEPTLTHRAGFELRDFAPVFNPIYDFQPSSGATTGLFTREIVKDESCNACHDQLAFHGDGSRKAVQYCMACHNPGSTDAQSGNTVDMTVMIHKIHYGEDLPSVRAGGEYAIWGNRNNKNDYSGVVFPQDIRNCGSCHDETDPEATPDAANWYEVPTVEACGSCHDDVNFETGENHATGIAASNDQCATCHGGNSPARADRVHVLLEQEAAKAFQYNIIGITGTGPGETPTVEFSVTDPTNNDEPYDVQNDDAFTTDQSTLRLRVAWESLALNNVGSNSFAATNRPAQPIEIDALFGGSADPDGDGVFSATAPSAIPAGVSGSGIVAIEGHPALDLDGDGEIGRSDRIPVTGVTEAYAITDEEAVPRPQIVDIARCNACHQQLSEHGNNRTDNPELCAVCHTPDTTDIGRRLSNDADSSNSPDGKDEETVHFKTMIHAIHRGADRTNSYVAYSGGGPNDFGEVVFPGELNNCENCHDGDTYYPVDPNALATTIDTGVDIDDPFDDLNITPNTAACWGCHDRAEAVSHMTLNGGAFDAIQQPDGTLISQSAGTVIEACDVCHGEGRIADVGEIHAHHE
jgi:OmcA/MtrC family decaheme c-type cytochrome